MENTLIYHLEIEDDVYKIFKKLEKKNKKQLKIIYNKIEEIRKNPYHFKPLHGDMHGIFRVHIDKSFVLLFEVNEERKLITIIGYDHHDRIYNP